ncbi:MAG: 2-C-methyl-D-erythritol 4-phosphate cytidylyltransferase [Lachnospiraceae bacterium]|nr:2-C-methyl-D-erythritol 4-phosphate cytidylyltransferase [Lachnospiraceae bacterium]
MSNIAMIIAGGSGARMQQDIPKQFLTVYEKPVIVYTLEAFQRHEMIDAIEVVCLEGWENILWAYAKQFNITKLKYVVKGGTNGQGSIKNGIDELCRHCSEDDTVLIHDAIRPLVSEEIITDCLKTTLEKGNAITVIPCAEAMLKTQDGEESSESFPRDNLRRTQTPQGFRLGNIKRLHERAAEKGIFNSVASCTLMVELGEKVYFSKGEEKNIKLTTVEDIDIFKALLNAKRSEWLK